MANKKTAPTKRLSVGQKVTWKCSHRWGKTKKTGAVVGFLPRNRSAAKLMTASQRKGFHGAEINTVNDRYLVEHEDGTFTAPRTTTIHRAMS